MSQEKTEPRIPDDKRRPLDQIGVVTLNLFGQQGEWHKRRPILQEGLQALQPDLIAFQEAIANEPYDQVVDVLGDSYYIAHQSLGLMGDGNHGASIASRWPLRQVWDVDLRLSQRPMDYPCGTLVAEIDVPEPFGPLLFICHGPWYPWWAEYEREQQALAAAQYVESLVGPHIRHVILAGDFNATPDTGSMRFWSGKQSLGAMSVCYQDAWERMHATEPGHTFSPRNALAFKDEPFLRQGRRIDYILVRCRDHGPTLDTAACELLFDQPAGNVWASDHFGVVADFIVPRRRL